MLRFHDFHYSGEAHKVRNMLSLLDVPHEAANGSSANDEAPEAFWQEPVLVDGDVTLNGSCAILVYLGRKYGRGRWLPVDAAGEARVQQFLSGTANEMLRGPTLAREIQLFGREGDLQKARAHAHALLARYEEHLAARPFLVGKCTTIADIASYTYIKLAPQGGVDPEGYRSVRDWLARLEQLHRFVPAPSPPAAPLNQLQHTTTQPREAS